MANEIEASLINGCLKGNQADQMRLYELYFSYGMAVCLRYSKNRDEAREILNDGFLRAFAKIHLFDAKKPFKPWIRRILIHSSIAYFKKYHNKEEAAAKYKAQVKAQVDYNLALDTLTFDDLLPLIQELPPAYRMVFNLYVMENLSHQEIATKLGVSIGTSKSNLSKARQKIKQLLEQSHDIFLN